MMFVFVVLYWNVYRKRVSVGMPSIVLAMTVPINWIWTASAIYGLQAPLHWRNGVLTDRARKRALTAATE